MKTFKKLPGVMSVDRGLVMSDGLMYNLLPSGDLTPVEVMRHGIRGAQNITNLNKTPNVSNIQITETARLDNDTSKMAVKFDIRYLDLRQGLKHCAKAEPGFKQSYLGYIDNAENSEGLEEVGRRFARNIVNGRWLGRNMAMAESVDVEVNIKGEKPLKFDSMAISHRDFDNYSDGELLIGSHIAKCLAGLQRKAISVTAIVDFGIKGIEVFPSQNFLSEKPDGFARSLYVYDGAKIAQSSFSKKTSMQLMGYAAIRDQKIGNALRTIDTWYEKYSENGFPIAVEPNGANIVEDEFFRLNEKHSAFGIVLRLNEVDPNSPEGMFMLASMVKGGVYSGPSEKAEKSKKDGKED